MMGEAEQRDLIARFVAAYNRFDVNGMLALVADDVRFENLSAGVVTASASGAAEFRALAEQATALFREREQRVTGVVFRDGVAVAAIAYRGVLAVDVPGGPPAGTVLELTGESEFGFTGARIGRLTDRS
ncbi:MAG: nuclear transport factor 2 family protein [Gemmatimonadaceae bacterium]|nr:nuclear transport factor 2 family protein [Gemmatimonadaceae bacterium]